MANKARDCLDGNITVSMEERVRGADQVAFWPRRNKKPKIRCSCTETHNVKALREEHALHFPGVIRARGRW